MTTIDPYHVTVDGHVLATYANGLEVVDGLEGVPARRVSEQHAAYVDGSWPAPSAVLPAFFSEKHQRLRIWVAPFDADGAVTYANGPRAHLRENLETLWRLVGGGAGSLHQIGFIVPTPTATKTLTNTARITAPIDPTGSTRLVRRLTLDFTYPFPIWRDSTTGLNTLGPFTGAQSFTPGGSAPLTDMILTCTSAGKITHDESGDFVEALAGFTTSLIIDQRPPKSVTHNGGDDGRAYYNANQPWGLRLPAGVEANLTITGTWQIDYYNPEHA